MKYIAILAVAIIIVVLGYLVYSKSCRVNVADIAVGSPVVMEDISKTLTDNPHKNKLYTENTTTLQGVPPKDELFPVNSSGELKKSSITESYLNIGAELDQQIAEYDNMIKTTPYMLDINNVTLKKNELEYIVY